MEDVMTSVNQKPASKREAGFALAFNFTQLGSSHYIVGVVIGSCSKASSSIEDSPIEPVLGELELAMTGCVISGSSVLLAFLLEMNFIIFVPQDEQTPCNARLPFLSVTSCASFIGFFVFSFTQ
jgi:hypothetical protein